jgi:DUF4097 and DUF4098 domain-containing protein YvlB
MKNFLAIAIIMLVAGTATAGDKITREFTIEPGHRLEVDLRTGGSIYVRGWDQSKVSVNAYVDRGDWDDFDVEFNQRDDEIIIRSRDLRKWGNRAFSMEFEIRVPRKFNLDLETDGGSINLYDIKGKINGKTMGGTLELENISGDIELITMGGEINASSVEGIVYLKTMGGNIYLNDTKADGEVETYGGQIYLNGVKGNIKSSTMGGSVIYDDVDIEDENHDIKAVRIKSMGGDIAVDEAPAGADVHTYGGDIEIRSAGKYVKAKTLGGNIDILEVDGEVDAVTMGGNVRVKMVGNPDKGPRDVEISSMGGDIELTLPSGVSADFDIELAFTKQHQGKFRIESDFDLAIDTTDNWDYSRGSKRKYIFGKGTVKDGKNKIHIETINGDIVIKKGS